MNGNVFQLPGERKKRGQFQERLKALKTVASLEFKKEIMYLEPLFRKLENPKLLKPVKPEPMTVTDDDGNVQEVKVDTVDMDIYKAKVAEYVKKEERIEQTKASLFNIVLGQCSDGMTNKLKDVKGYETMELTADVAGLLRSIRDLSNKVEENVSVYETLDDLKRQFYLYHQQPFEDNATHLEKFQDLVDVLEHFGSTCFLDDILVEHEKKNGKRSEDRETGHCEKTSREKYLAICFLRRANMLTYGPLLRELRDQRLHGVDLYPSTLAEAYSLLENHSSGKRRNNNTSERTKPRSDMIGGIHHAHKTKEELAPGADGRLNPRVLCFKCQNMGHYADNCPESTRNGQVHMHSAFIEEVEEDWSDDGSIEISYTFFEGQAWE